MQLDTSPMNLSSKYTKEQCSVSDQVAVFTRVLVCLATSLVLDRTLANIFSIPCIPETTWSTRPSCDASLLPICSPVNMRRLHTCSGILCLAARETIPGASPLLTSGKEKVADSSAITTSAKQGKSMPPPYVFP